MLAVAAEEFMHVYGVSGCTPWLAATRSHSRLGAHHADYVFNTGSGGQHSWVFDEHVLPHNVCVLQSCVPAAGRLLAACRAAGVKVIHTLEGHKADLSDLHPSKVSGFELLMLRV